MTYWIFVITAFLLFVFLLLLLRNTKRIGEVGKRLEDFSSLKDEFLVMRKEISDRLSDVSRTTGVSTRIMADVQKGLGVVEEATKRVLDLSQGLQEIQQILSPPKLRGSLGELFLEELLAQVLPAEAYKIQYQFKTGSTVDAAIKIGSRLVPVDAKFPLENFKRVIESQTEEERASIRRRFLTDVKKHINDIAEKYILPDEGTYDFALMYIPAENIYYEIITRDESAREERGIFSYAIERKVIPVSPNSFYAYLQVIALGLKGMTLEKNARQILENLKRIEGDLGRFREDFEVLGKHLRDAEAKYADADKNLARIENKLISLEKPQVSELSD